MKHLVGTLILIIFFISSCSEVEKKTAFRELQIAEYTRTADTQKISSWLNHDNPEIRLKAVETLGRIQDDTRKNLIVNRLKDKDMRVRNAAIFALGQLNNIKVSDDLIKMLPVETLKEAKLNILNAISKSGFLQNSDFPIRLKEFLETGDSDFQQEAAIAAGVLAYKGFAPFQAIASLSKLMVTTPDPEVAWRAAYAVYRIGMLGAFNDLVTALENNDPVTKYFVLKGLNHCIFLINTPRFQKMRKNPEYKELVSTFYSTDFKNKITAQLQNPSWYVRIAALELFGNWQDKSAQKEIIKLLNDPHPNVQIQAIRNLAKHNQWIARREVRRIYKEAQDWRKRGEALLVLATIQPKEALLHVKNDFLNLSWPKTYYAIKILEKIEATDKKRFVKEADEATKLLMQLADGNNIAQTTAALEVLVKRSKPPVTEYFLEKLKTGDVPIANIVAQDFLSLIKAPKPTEAVKPLIDVYNSFIAPRDLEAMGPVLATLDSIGSPDAVPFLEEQLKSPYPVIQEIAQRALQNITGDKNVVIPFVETAYTTKWDFPPVSLDFTYLVKFTTTRGEFIMELFPEKAPVTVANFISLIQNDFYNGIFIHRVEPGFVIQAGDPRGDGWGGPGYWIPCEYNDLRYDRGMVGMALSGKDTGGSQFFVTHLPQPHLDGNYTIFGKIVSGMETIDNLMIFDQIQRTDMIITAKPDNVVAN